MDKISSCNLHINASRDDGKTSALVSALIAARPSERGECVLEIRKEHYAWADVRALAISLSKDRGQEAGIATYQEYTVNWGSNPSDKDVKKTVVDIETDYIFLVPTQAALYLHTDHAKTARTYSYLFSEPSRMPIFPLWMGADHADDLQYVFGKPFTTPLGYFPRHRDASRYMIAYWTNFAHTGDPNKGESSVPVTWPEFAGTGHKYLDIHGDMNRNSVKQMLRTRMVYYWTTVFAGYPTVKN